jgi:glycosyltransferase involved in cell wall biosynthesis
MSAGAKFQDADPMFFIPGRLYCVSPYADLTGAPISSLNHARLLRNHFQSACLVLSESGEIQKRATEAGVPVLLLLVETRGFRSHFFRRSLGKDLRAVLGSRWRYFRSLIRVLRQAPGIVHVHSRASIAPLALGAARWCGMPSVLHIREPATSSYCERLWTKMLVNLASSVVCVSAGTRRGYGAEIRRRAQVIYNFMDIPPPFLSKDHPVPLVGMPAQMGHRKGVDVFLQVCRLLSEGENVFKAWLVGGWETEEEHRKAVEYLRTNQLESNVSDCGVVLDMKPIYAQMDILLLPARRDPLPRVVMEAMGNGIPVVSTRVDGIPEMVEDGVTGFLADSEDVVKLTEKVAQLLIDGNLRRQMGEAGRVRATALFSPETYEREMMKLYRRLLEKRGLPSPGPSIPEA